MPADLTIAITNACGCGRSFQAGRASFNFEAGSLELQAGCPAYYRQFDDAVLRISDPAGETVLMFHNGTASLSATALHILCESFRDESSGDQPSS